MSTYQDLFMNLQSVITTSKIEKKLHHVQSKQHQSLLLQQKVDHLKTHISSLCKEVFQFSEFLQNLIKDAKIEKSKQKENDSKVLEHEWRELKKERLIGCGAHGQVFQTSNPRIACKVFENGLVSVEGVREVSSLAWMRHSPHVLTCLHIDEEGVVYFPYYAHNLRTFMHSQKYSRLDVKRILFQLALGIFDLKQQNILHRDLKPENILIDPLTRKIVICDFGLARFFQSHWCPQTTVVQTLWYRAPEILLEDAHYTSRIEVWSLGVMMCDLLLHSQSDMFRGTTSSAQLFKLFQLRGPPGKPEQGDLLNHFKNNKFMKHEEKEFPGRGRAHMEHLLCSLLTLNPEERISIEEVLEHPFFEEVRFEEQTTLPKPLPRVWCESLHQTQTQTDQQVPPDDRYVVLDWLIYLTCHLFLSHQTYFLAARFFDSFLEREPIARHRLQLLGSAALYLASLSCEMHPCVLRKILDADKNTFSARELEEKSHHVLKVLKYNAFLKTEFIHLIQHIPNAQQSGILKHLYKLSLFVPTRSLPFAELMSLIPDETKLKKRGCYGISKMMIRIEKEHAEQKLFV